MSKELEDAIAYGNLEKAILLIDKGVDLNYISEDGLNLLTIALDYTHIGIAELLFDKGVDINVSENVPLTPLEAALESGASEIIIKMINMGVNVNQKGFDEEEYPIHRLAWGYLEPDLFKKFIEAGANLSLKNDEGETAMDIIKNNLIDNPEHEDTIFEIIALLK